MRLEWGSAIANRRWDVLENVAKKNPSQQLCDTAHELLLGMELKSDRRALKKVLYLLEQGGFTPTVQAPESPLEQLADRVILAAHTKPETHGGASYVVCIQQGVNNRFLHLQFHERTRFAHAFKKDVPVRATQPLIKNFDRLLTSGYRPISPDFCLFRIARSLMYQVHGTKPRFDHLWLEIFSRVREVEHPGSRVQPATATSAQRQAYLQNHPDFQKWRCGICELDPIWQEIQPLRMEYVHNRTLMVERLTEWFLDNRTYFFDPAFYDDHCLRLLDHIAWETTSGEGQPAMTAALLEDLQKRRSRSDYAEFILRLTAANIEDEMGPDDLEELEDFALAA